MTRCENLCERHFFAMGDTVWVRVSIEGEVVKLLAYVGVSEPA